MKNRQPSHPLDRKLQKIVDLLEQLIAVEMYKGGATQSEIAVNLVMAAGKVNKLIKGVMPPKNNYDEA